MHFALPTRAHHRSSPFLTNSASRSFLPIGRSPYALIIFLIVGILLLWNYCRDGPPAGTPDTVLVLLLNRTSHSEDHINKIIQNRKDYANAHGYGLHIKNVNDYPGGGASSGWAKIPAMRHAMNQYKYSKVFWYLDQNAIIMNPKLSIEDHIMRPSRLGSLLRRDVPIVPPDSVIKTYRHTAPERVQIVLSQDHEGLQPGSMIIKSGKWAEYFLDAWYDPIFRFYNFQKAERHALEHIVQWHPTILTKLALIPQKTFNSYAPLPGSEGNYEDGDFVVHFHGCDAPERNCEKEFMKYWDKRQTL